MPTKKVIVELSLAEARALLHGMGGSITDKETAYAFYLDSPTVAAAYRAAKKLSTSVQAALPKKRG